jgi:hypothetical protein
MDSIIDKLLEAIKDKMSKKQVIAIVGMITLAVMKPATKTELMVAGFVTLIAIVAISTQTYLDGKGVKNGANNDVPNVSAGG